MLPIGSPAPHFELHDLAGDRKTLSDFLDLVVQSADILWVWVTVLMWIPGLASILFRFVFREGFADVGWRVGRIRFFQKRNPAGARRSKMKIVSVAVSGVGVSVCRCEIETLEEVSPFPRCAEAQLDTSRPQC